MWRYLLAAVLVALPLAGRAQECAGCGATITSIANGTSISITAPVVNTTPLTISGYSLTGSDTHSMVSQSGTLNTSGAAVVLNTAITCTSCASAFAEKILGGAAGATLLRSLDMSGNEVLAGTVTPTRLIVPNSYVANAPTFTSAGNLTSGLQFSGASLFYSDSGTATVAFAASVGVRVGGTYIYGFSPGNVDAAAADTAISRPSPGLIAVGNGTAGDFTGGIKLATVTATGQVQSNSLSVITKVVRQTFAATGTYTPSTGMLFADAECVGSGGGGGGAAAAAAGNSAGGGGGAGSYSKVRLTAAQVGASQTVTVGNAGSGGSTGANNGTAGADVSVGTLCVGKGGGLGVGAATTTAGAPGAGGVAGTGDITGVGESGTTGVGASISTINGFGGKGGNTMWGGSAALVVTSASIANGAAPSATAYGAGGNGGSVDGSASTAAGGNGAKGFVAVTEYTTQ